MFSDLESSSIWREVINRDPWHSAAVGLDSMKVFWTACYELKCCVKPEVFRNSRLQIEHVRRYGLCCRSEREWAAGIMWTKPVRSEGEKRLIFNFESSTRHLMKIYSSDCTRETWTVMWFSCWAITHDPCWWLRLKYLPVVIKQAET